MIDEVYFILINVASTLRKRYFHGIKSYAKDKTRRLKRGIVKTKTVYLYIMLFIGKKK